SGGDDEANRAASELHDGFSFELKCVAMEVRSPPHPSLKACLRLCLSGSFRLIQGFRSCEVTS
ncbi:hypothetical protein HAX54_020008, partial [Datura stramonium]|nr:hypothetical protein [Datura stramonium]